MRLLPMTEVVNGLGKLRRKRGLSAIQLASAVGVSRQTIYAMEAGSFVPNTMVALRLARALETTVESLFVLSGDDSTPVLRPARATILPESGVLEAGQAVQLCRVDKKLIASAPAPVSWYFPPADAISAGGAVHQGKGSVQVFQPGDFSQRILVAGCDPGISVLARRVQSTGVELVLAHRNSSQALDLLKAGCIHIAGTHLPGESSEELELPRISRMFTKRPVAVFTFAVWEVGIVTAHRNPKNIRAVEDLSRKDVLIVNRESGSGSRALLDSQMKDLGIEAHRIRGYDQFASGHLAAAWQVHSGLVDCCIATRASARLLGLGFIPLVSQRYDLVIRKQHLELPRIQQLLDTLSRSDLRRELEGLGGYNTSGSGQQLL